MKKDIKNSMMQAQQIKFNIIKVSTNQYYSGKHWTHRFKHKNAYKLICSCFKNQLTPVDYKINIKADFYIASRIIDSSNTTSMLKMIEDGLTENGIIKDDSNKYVGWIACRASKAPKGTKDDYCILTIEKADSC